MTLHKNVRTQLVQSLSRDVEADPRLLNDALRLLSKWRAHLIQNTLIQKQGLVVAEGPLAGLEFLPNSAEGCHIPKLLGCYEQPLHPHIEAAIASAYPVILNIGCAEGYYAVGMARRMPESRVLAFDIDPKAREICDALAQKNGVRNRIEIGGLFNPEDFAAHARDRVLLMCDIEGSEDRLLDPDASPALRSMDIIVESHECIVPGVTDRLINRFSASHDISKIEDDGQRQLSAAPAWFNSLAHLDQLLATWEWRSGPTPWLVMKSKSTLAG